MLVENEKCHKRKVSTTEMQYISAKSSKVKNYICFKGKGGQYGETLEIILTKTE